MRRRSHQVGTYQTTVYSSPHFSYVSHVVRKLLAVMRKSVESHDDLFCRFGA